MFEIDLFMYMLVLILTKKYCSNFFLGANYTPPMS